MEPYFITHICLFGGNFAPRGWAFCQGQLLPIAQYTAVFALLGTTYGGNGQTTFALPDFRGRMPVGQGQGPGLSSFSLGEISGFFNTTLLASQMPSHTHTASVTVPVKSTAGNSANPGGAVISGGTTSTYAPAANVTGNLAGISATVNAAGSGQPFSNTMPSLGINFIIALEGIFPSRN